MAVTFGYTIFYVNDVAATVDFFTSAFGLAAKFVTPEQDYGELDTGSTTLAFASVPLAGNNLKAAGGFTPLDPSLPPVGASISLLAADVPATLEDAMAAGATSFVAPVVKPWGQTVAYLRDPNGILVEVATPMAD